MTLNDSAKKNNPFASLTAKKQDPTKIKDPVLFMVSSGRSGTTLLRSILNASNQLFIPHESDFIGRAYRFYQKKSEFTSEDYEKIAKLFMATSREQGWGLNREYLVSYLNYYQPQNFTAVNRVINQAYHEQEGTENLLWGIKSPVMIASLKEILNVFPNTQIIHVIRDGRDVYLSYQKVHQKSQVKFGPKELLPAALYWIDGLRRIERFQEQSNGRVYEIRYEDFVKNPADEIASLCKFIGIEYSPFMYQEHHNMERNQKLVSPEFMKSFHSKAKQGLDPSNVGKFHGAMSKRERFFFELLTAPFLQKYNYPIEFQFLLLPVWNVVRVPLYFMSQLFNNWRYRRRDFKSLQWANIDQI